LELEAIILKREWAILPSHLDHGESCGSFVCSLCSVVCQWSGPLQQWL